MLVVTLALARQINRTAVWYKGIVNINIYVLKKVFVHKISVALVICAVETDIFVKINRGNLAEINVSLFVPLYKLVYKCLKATSLWQVLKRYQALKLPVPK